MRGPEKISQSFDITTFFIFMCASIQIKGSNDARERNILK